MLYRQPVLPSETPTTDDNCPGETASNNAPAPVPQRDHDSDLDRHRCFQAIRQPVPS
ncbi:MAG: hypothetical protein MZV63_56020 [Marinilabiliales bacterium]|nr:hypothetical protein [Marinilabiliales bacterium]